MKRLKVYFLVLFLLQITLSANQQDSKVMINQCIIDGDAQICYDLGHFFSNKKKYIDAIKFYEQACTLGKAEGCLEAGHRYYNGLGVEENVSTAIKYYTASFKKGLLGGYINIGNIYSQGLKGITKDQKKANMYYQTACNSGDDIACKILENQIQKTNSEEDLKSIKGLAELCDDGKIIRSIYCNAIGDTYQKYHMYEQAMHYYKKGCNNKFNGGCLKLGEFYINSKNDYVSGLKYIDKACENGSYEACYKSGTFYKKDHNTIKAKESFKKGCNLEHMDSCKEFNLLNGVSPQIINIETNGNLESKLPIDCISVDQLSNKNTPADIFVGIDKCMNVDDYERATKLYLVAMVYGRFDMLRVKDKSAHQALTVLKMNYFSKLEQNNQLKFQALLKKELNSRTSICKTFEKLGKPNYFPSYMIQHGIRAFNSNKQDNGLVEDFDSNTGWKKGVLEIPCQSDKIISRIDNGTTNQF